MGVGPWGGGDGGEELRHVKILEFLGKPPTPNLHQTSGFKGQTDRGESQEAGGS